MRKTGKVRERIIYGEGGSERKRNGERKRSRGRKPGGGKRAVRLQRSRSSHLLVICSETEAHLFIIDWDHALYSTMYMCDNTSGQHLNSLIASVDTLMMPC